MIKRTLSGLPGLALMINPRTMCRGGIAFATMWAEIGVSQMINIYRKRLDSTGAGEPDSIPTPEMIAAGLNEWFADAWAETEEDRMARVFFAMERCRPK